MSEETFDKVEFVDTPEQLQESIQSDLQGQPQQEQQPQETVLAQPEAQTPNNQNVNSVAEQLNQHLGNRGIMNVKI